jgi:hypothetical protein
VTKPFKLSDRFCSLLSKGLLRLVVSSLSAPRAYSFLYPSLYCAGVVRRVQLSTRNIAWLS